MNNDNSRQYYDDEIDFREIYKSLRERNRFIVGFTGVVTLLAIGYVLFLPSPIPQYMIEASVLKPTESSIIKLNKYSELNDRVTSNIPGKNGLDKTANTSITATSVFNKFLTTLNSQVLQKEVYINGGYSEKLGKENVPSFLITKDKEKAGVLLPHIVSTRSIHPIIVSEFLNEVLTAADKETVNYFINVQMLKISNRLNEITKKRQLLLTETKKDRQSKIKRIKEADNQKLQEAKNKIDAARFIAAQERMNQIALLTHAAQLASTLGIIENNLNQLVTGGANANLNIAIQSRTDIPDWYLYGETVLLEMIALLNNRESDDPFIPELAVLENKIKEIKNNILLQTLEQRLDDSPFNPKINQLDVETINLKSISFNPDSSGIKAVELYQAATSVIIETKSRNLLKIALAFFGGFILSILCVLLMNALKEEDVTSIQNSK